MSEIDFTSSGQRVVVEETPRAIVKSLAPVVEGVVRGAAQGDIEKTVATVKTGLRATFNELQAKQAEIEELEAEGAPIADIEALTREIKQIRLGQRQGGKRRLTTSAGMARINARVAELGNAFPAFRADIVRLKDSLTGRSGGQDLSPELSFEEQLAEKAEILERNLTINRGLNPDSTRDRTTTRLLLMEEQTREQLRFEMAQRADLRASDKAGREQLRFEMAQRADLRASDKAGREAAGELRAEAAAGRAADAATRAGEFRENKAEIATLSVNPFIDKVNITLNILDQLNQGAPLSPDQVRDTIVKISQEYRLALADINGANLSTSDRKDLINIITTTRDSVIANVRLLDAAQIAQDELAYTTTRLELGIKTEFATAAVIKEIYGSQQNFSSTVESLRRIESTAQGEKMVRRQGFSFLERYMAPWKRINGENFFELNQRWKEGGARPEEWEQLLLTIQFVLDDLQAVPEKRNAR